MTMVWSDPAGFAVDWDWQRSLTVWELAGRRFTSRFDRKVLEHELSARPAGELVVVMGHSFGAGQLTLPELSASAPPPAPSGALRCWDSTPAIQFQMARIAVTLMCALHPRSQAIQGTGNPARQMGCRRRARPSWQPRTRPLPGPG